MARLPLSSRHSRAFVTGASSGLGRAFSEMLLAEGLEVWGSSRELHRLQCFSGQSRFHPVVLDLAVEGSAAEALVLAEREAGGPLDVVILNAGYGIFAPFEEQPFGVWRAQLGILLVETAALAHAARSRMSTLDTPSALVLVSSLAAEFPLPFMAGYNMSKAALSSLAETLMDEAHDPRLSIIDFRPGDYRTDFNRGMEARGALHTARTEAVWSHVEASLRDAPEVSRAAADLRRTLARGRSATVRSGSFFQTRLAPLLTLLPFGLQRRLRAAYFGNRN